MRRRISGRTLPLLLAASLALAASPGADARPSAPAQAAPKIPRLLFPVIGTATYGNDFGDPRGAHRHAGIDIMAPRKAIAVAAEGGTVRFHTTSRLAGCMLYLNGDSGTTYLYVHLNNDLTSGNDNRGKCVPGVAYARGLKSGDRVVAGQPVGFVGNSGDADSTAPHLHFEVHPAGRGAVNPFEHLRKARKLLFPAQPTTLVTLALRGTVVAAPEGALRLRVDELRRWPGGLHVKKVGRTLDLALPAYALVFDPAGGIGTPKRLLQAKPGSRAVVHTDPALATLATALGTPRALSTQSVVLRP
jgi:hypothetical protein